MKYIRLRKIKIHWDVNRNTTEEIMDRMRKENWQWWDEGSGDPITPVIDFIFAHKDNYDTYFFKWRPDFAAIIQYDCAKGFTEEIRYPRSLGHKAGDMPLDFMAKVIKEAFHIFFKPVAENFENTDTFHETDAFKNFEKYIKEECGKVGIPKEAKIYLEFEDDRNSFRME